MVPLCIDSYWTGEISQVAILAMAAMGFNVTFGYAGELALQQAAIYAVGAYVGAVLLNHGVAVPFAILGVLVAALAVGLVTGLPGLRFSGWSLALLTFFMVFVIPDLVLLFKSQTGGTIGLSITTYWSVGRLYELTLGVLVVSLFVIRNLVTSQWGLTLKVMRQSPELAESFGIKVHTVKFAAYVLGALPAAAAGMLFALSEGFINTTDFDLNLAVLILAAGVLGGLGSVYGPVLGAAVLVLLPERLSTFGQYSIVVYGAVLVLVAVAVPGGGAGLFRKLIARLGLDRFTASPPGGSSAAEPPSADSAVARLTADDDVSRAAGSLDVDGVSVSFDGLRALDSVSMSAQPGVVTGLVGPNGSGKTTLLNVINGYVTPAAGSINVNGTTVRPGRPAAISRSGLARTFQTPRIPEDMTTLDAVRAALFSERSVNVVQSILRTRGWWRATRAETQRAVAALDAVGLYARAGQMASGLSLGEKRLLEIARALVRRPSVVLLDEPASGLSEHEIEEFVIALDELKKTSAAIILVEHNAALVHRVADRVYCLATGRVIASGEPEAVLSDERVIQAWLGRAEHATKEPAS